MTEAILVAGVVRTLAEYAFPDDPALIDQAVGDAVTAYWSGASVSEACRVGQASIAGHHPAGDAASAVRRVAGPMSDQAA